MFLVVVGHANHQQDEIQGIVLAAEAPITQIVDNFDLKRREREITTVVNEIGHTNQFRALSPNIRYFNAGLV
jgi:hypothetical protein